MAKSSGGNMAAPLPLGANENPFGPSPRAVRAMSGALAGLNLYPARDDTALRTALAHDFGRGLTAEHFLAANGGCEVLSMIEDGLMQPGDRAIICPPCFAPYRSSLKAKGMAFDEVPLSRPGFVPDVAAILAAVTPETRLLYITNPNNPTGTYFDGALLDRLLDALPDRVIVIYDEVYHHFSEDLPDAISRVLAGRRLIAVHSFSKAFGLAGARIGYAMASPELIARVAPRKRSYHINGVSLAGALAALDDTAFLSRVVDNNTAERARLSEGLRALGLTVWDSAANFVLFEVPGGDAAALCQRIGARGIEVRPGFDLPGHVRVSIGLPDQNAAFLAALSTELQHV